MEHGAKMMRSLIRHELNEEKALSYVMDNLDKATALSSELGKLLDFTTGSFYTLLLEGSNIERLYEFEAGAILPQNPVIKYFHQVYGYIFYYSFNTK